MRIYLIGFMGSGKSHWGRIISSGMQLPFFDLDTMIEERQGKTIAAIFDELGEEAFRRMEKTVLEELTAAHENMVLSCGGGTPCFFGNIDFMKGRGKVIWLNTGIDTLVRRLMKEKQHRPLLRDIPDNDMKAVILKKLHDRKIYYEQAHIALPEEDLTPEQIITAIQHA